MNKNIEKIHNGAPKYYESQSENKTVKRFPK